MKALLLIPLLCAPLAAAEPCPKGPFVAGGPGMVPPVARLLLFWPREKPPTVPKLTVELLAGVSLPFTLQRLSRDESWDVYALTVVADPKMTYRVSADAAHPGLRAEFYAEAHWKKLSEGAKPAAYRLERTVKGVKKASVLPPASACFPWPKGAAAVGLYADGRDQP